MPAGSTTRCAGRPSPSPDAAGPLEREMPRRRAAPGHFRARPGASDAGSAAHGLAVAGDRVEAVGEHRVRPAVAGDRVGHAVARLDRVVAALAGEDVRPATTVELVVAVASEDRLGAIVADDAVALAGADDALDARRARAHLEVERDRRAALVQRVPAGAGGHRAPDEARAERVCVVAAAAVQ